MGVLAPVNSGHFVLPAIHKGSACTQIGQIVYLDLFAIGWLELASILLVPSKVINLTLQPGPYPDLGMATPRSALTPKARLGQAHISPAIHQTLDTAGSIPHLPPRR